jgi:hypothetical protein
MTGEALRILGVHGVKNYQPGLNPRQAAERLAGWWRSAICMGLALPKECAHVAIIDVAYYAQHLHLSVVQGDEDPGALDPEVQQLIVAWAKVCGAPEEMAQGRLAAPARAAVEWIAQKYGLEHRPTRILTTTFFREVQTYFTDPERREAAVADVAEAIQCTRPDVVIAHSLGSVVAYEALWAYPEQPVDLLLTIGSPLAMPDIVLNRLSVHEGPRRRPPGVAKWINIADPGDFIAVPKGGIGANFRLVAADLTDAIGAFSFHQVTKYLRCGATSGVLASYLPQLDDHIERISLDGARD